MENYEFTQQEEEKVIREYEEMLEKETFENDLFEEHEENKFPQVEIKAEYENRNGKRFLKIDDEYVEVKITKVKSGLRVMPT